MILEFAPDQIFKGWVWKYDDIVYIRFLPENEELQFIAKSTNAGIIGISKFQLSESTLETEILTDNYIILVCHRNKHRRDAAFYIRN